MNTIILRSNTYGSLTEAVLEAFEREVKTRLPDDYRAFLLEHNGGTPQPACFLAPDDPFEGEDSSLSEREVSCFFALHYNGWDDNTREGNLAFPLQEAWRDLTRVRPEDLLPIGSDTNGSLLCIALTGEERGQVFFDDHEWEAHTLLAPNFDQFLAVLRVCEVVG